MTMSHLLWIQCLFSGTWASVNKHATTSTPPCTFGFFPNSHSLFLVLLIGCFGSGRCPGAPSLSLSPLGVLLMAPSEPVLLRFWLKSSKGKSPGGSKPDLNDSTTMIESWEEGRIETDGQMSSGRRREEDFFQHPAFLSSLSPSLPYVSLQLVSSGLFPYSTSVLQSTTYLSLIDSFGSRNHPF